MGRSLSIVIAAAALLGLVASLVALLEGSRGGAEPGVTTRVSVASGGAQANGLSDRPAISADGRYVSFEGANARNLVPGDTNGVADVFVHDLQTGATERVSVDSADGQSNNGSAYSAMSDDGRYVAFQSIATNLVPGDTNAQIDTFVRDRQLGATTRVSVASGGGQATVGGGSPSISGDGRYVAFMSPGPDLVPGDTNGAPDVFVHDRQTGLTERVSVSSAGAQASGPSTTPSLSGDGRYVAFASAAPDLVPGDTNGAVDVFVRDRVAGATERVSLGAGGTQGNGDSGAIGAFVEGYVSDDGRYVVFASSASNLVAGDTNGAADVFLRDRQLGTTARVSVDSAGNEANGESFLPTISGDGTTVVFGSRASNLVPGDSNGSSDAFVRDLQTGTTTRVSTSSGGDQGNGATPQGDDDDEPSAVSADGRYVSYASLASNLVPGDTNGTWDVFVHDRTASAPTPTPTPPPGPDTDGDGCTDEQELGPNAALGGGRDPNNPYDFYDITNVSLVVGAKDRGVSAFDLSLIIQYGGATDGGGPNAAGKDYNADTNGNTTDDGPEIDFAGAPGPHTGPDGGISGFDLSDLLSQGGDSCASSGGSWPPGAIDVQTDVILPEDDLLLTSIRYLPAIPPEGSVWEPEVYAMDVDTGSYRRLTFDEQPMRHMAASPDRQKLALTRIPADTNGDGQRDELDDQVVWVIHLVAGKAWMLTPPGASGGAGGIDWLDNETLVFNYRDAPADLYDIVAADYLTGARTNLTNTPTIGEGDVSVSPDGSFIVYIAVDTADILGFDEFGPIFKGKVWMRDASGANPRQLTDGGPIIGRISLLPAGDYDPEFSPDSTQVVFPRAVALGGNDLNPDDNIPGAGTHHIFTVNVQTLGVQELTQNDSVALIPDWAGDGTIYFTEVAITSEHAPDFYLGISTTTTAGGLTRIEPFSLADIWKGALVVKLIPAGP